jgi:hypothetical protein
MLSLGVAVILGFSGISKIIQGDLADYLTGMGMFPDWSVRWVAAGAIVLELATAALLLSSRSRHAGWYLVAGLASAFTVIHVAAAALGDVKPCCCVGFQLSRHALGHHLLMSGICLGLVAAAAWSLRAPRRSKRLWAERVG